ncbi:MAG: hypothetical protein ACOYKZ_07245 [Chlamydiia bacterium]
MVPFFSRRTILCGVMAFGTLWMLPWGLGHLCMKLTCGSTPYHFEKSQWTIGGIALSGVTVADQTVAHLSLQVQRRPEWRVMLTIEDAEITWLGEPLPHWTRERSSLPRSLPLHVLLTSALVHIPGTALPISLMGQYDQKEGNGSLNLQIRHGAGEAHLSAIVPADATLAEEITFTTERLALSLVDKMLSALKISPLHDLHLEAGSLSGQVTGPMDHLSGDLVVRDLEASMRGLQMQIGMEEGILSIAGQDAIHLNVSRHGWVRWGRTGVDQLEGSILWTDHPEFDLRGLLTAHPDKRVHLSHHSPEPGLAARLELLRVPLRPAIAEIRFEEHPQEWECRLSLCDFATEETALLKELLHTQFALSEEWGWSLDRLEADASLFWKEGQFQRMKLHQLHVQQATLDLQEKGTFSCEELVANGEGNAQPSTWGGELEIHGLTGGWKGSPGRPLHGGEIALQLRLGDSPLWSLSCNIFGGALSLENSVQNGLVGHWEGSLQTQELLEQWPMASSIGDALSLNVKEQGDQWLFTGALSTSIGELPVEGSLPSPTLDNLHAWYQGPLHIALPAIPIQTAWEDLEISQIWTCAVDHTANGWEAVLDLTEGSYRLANESHACTPQRLFSGTLSPRQAEGDFSLVLADQRQLQLHLSLTPEEMGVQGKVQWDRTALDVAGGWDRAAKKANLSVERDRQTLASFQWNVEEEAANAWKFQLQRGFLPRLHLDKADWKLAGLSLSDPELVGRCSRKYLLGWTKPWIPTKLMESWATDQTPEQISLTLQAHKGQGDWNMELHAADPTAEPFDLVIQQEEQDWCLEQLRLGDVMMEGRFKLGLAGLELEQLHFIEAAPPHQVHFQVCQTPEAMAFAIARDGWAPLIMSLSQHLPALQSIAEWVELKEDLHGSAHLCDTFQCHLPHCLIDLKAVPLDLDDVWITCEGSQCLVTGQFRNYGQQDPFLLQIVQHPSGSGEAHLTLGIEQSSLAWTFDDEGRWMPLWLGGTLCGQSGKMICDPKVPGRLHGSLALDLERLRLLLPPKVREAFTTLGLGSGLTFDGALDLTGNELALEGSLRGHNAHVFHSTWKRVRSGFYCSPSVVTLLNLQLEEAGGALHVPIITMREEKPSPSNAPSAPPVYPKPDLPWRIEIPFAHAQHLHASKVRWPHQMDPSFKVLEIQEAILADVAGPLDRIERWSGHGFVRFDNEAPRPALFFLPAELLGNLGLDFALLEPVKGTVHYAFEDGEIRLKQLQDVVSIKKRSQFALHPDPRFNRIGFDGSLNIRITMKQYVLFRIMEPLNLYVTGSIEEPEVSFQHSDKRCSGLDCSETLSRSSSPLPAPTALKP